MAGGGHEDEYSATRRSTAKATQCMCETRLGGFTVPLAGTDYTYLMERLRVKYIWDYTDFWAKVKTERKKREREKGSVNCNGASFYLFVDISIEDFHWGKVISKLPLWLHYLGRAQLCSICLVFLNHQYTTAREHTLTRKWVNIASSENDCCQA